nr:hypothetical protein [Paenibacillus protaetiae]
MNGWVTAVNGIGGAIFLSIGGFAASFGWRSVFLSYAYAIVLLVLVVLFLPKFQPSQAQRSNRTSAQQSLSHFIG